MTVLELAIKLMLFIVVGYVARKLKIMADGFDKSTFGDSIEAIYRSVLKPKADSAVPESVR